MNVVRRQSIGHLLPIIDWFGVIVVATTQTQPTGIGFCESHLDHVNQMGDVDDDEDIALRQSNKVIGHIHVN